VRHLGWTLYCIIRLMRYVADEPALVHQSLFYFDLFIRGYYNLESMTQQEPSHYKVWRDLTINSFGYEQPKKDRGSIISSHFKSYLSIASPRRKEGHVQFGTGSAQREGNSQRGVTFLCIRFLIRALSGCESCLRDSWSGKFLRM